MRNFIQKGKALDLVAPTGGVLSGLPYLIGASLVVIAANDALVGEKFVGERDGVYEVDTAGTFAVGAAVYITSAHAVVSTASGNVLMGTAVSASADGKVKVLVK